MEGTHVHVLKEWGFHCWHKQQFVLYSAQNILFLVCLIWRSKFIGVFFSWLCQLQIRPLLLHLGHRCLVTYDFIRITPSARSSSFTLKSDCSCGAALKCPNQPLHNAEICLRGRTAWGVLNWTVLIGYGKELGWFFDFCFIYGTSCQVRQISRFSICVQL